MKIIHCSDLHLDSRMEANLSFKQAQERNNEICTTFSRMVTYATDHKVSVIMIVGDLFDTERILAKTSGYFLDTVAQASEIDFLYLRGNHDESRRAFAGRMRISLQRSACFASAVCRFASNGLKSSAKPQS